MTVVSSQFALNAAEFFLCHTVAEANSVNGTKYPKKNDKIFKS